MPRLHNMGMIFLNYFTNIVEILRGKPKIFTESNWFQPKLANLFTFLHVYMNRLIAIKTVKEKTIFALDSFNCGHGEYTGKFNI